MYENSAKAHWVKVLQISTFYGYLNSYVHSMSYILSCVKLELLRPQIVVFYECPDLDNLPDYRVMKHYYIVLFLKLELPILL